MKSDLGKDSVIIRFGYSTPYWPLSMSYGTFKDTDTNVIYISPEHYIGHHRVIDSALRNSILCSPNGYIANQQLSHLISSAPETLDPRWEENRDRVMQRCIQFKYNQNPMMQEILLRTRYRPLFDCSRLDELYWCHSEGNGKNMHGKLLEEYRTQMLKRQGILESSK